MAVYIYKDKHGFVHVLESEKDVRQYSAGDKIFKLDYLGGGMKDPGNHGDPWFEERLKKCFEPEIKLVK